MDEYAVVLGGGGAKGVYQIGVWKALNELKIKHHAVMGTSIGAINGALMVQGDYEKADKMWHTIALDTVLSIPQEMIREGKFVLTSENFDAFVKLQKSVLRNRGVDTTPLRTLLEKYIDEKVLRKSSVDYGVVSFNVNTLRPIEVFKEEIEPGNLHNFLMASSALPGLKQVKIDGNIAIDGGVHDNVPYSLAKRRGYRRIIVVDVSGPGRYRHPELFGTDTIYIKNSRDLGSILEVDQDIYERNKELGYLDTMKIFGKYTGVQYTYSDNPGIKEDIETYINAHQTELVALCGKKENTPLRSLLPHQYRVHKDLAGALTECAAVALKIDASHLYTYKELVNAVATGYRRLILKKKTYENNNAVELLLKVIKDKKDIFNLSALEYDLALTFLINNNKNYPWMPGDTLSTIIAELYGAKMFFKIIDGIW